MNAFTPKQSSALAQDLQKARNCAKQPTGNQYLHIHKPADTLRAQQIKAGSIGPKKQNPGLREQTGAFIDSPSHGETAMNEMYQGPAVGAIGGGQ